jgi:integrase
MNATLLCVALLVPGYGEKDIRKGLKDAGVRGGVRERLALLGVERRLIYKTLVLTGLRKGELASLTVAHLHLDEAVPFATLDAADEKNREGNDIALLDRLDHVRLHGPEAARRSRGPPRAAGAADRRSTRRRGSHPGDGHGGKGPQFGCTNS